tara:strand:+ start:37910 stop:38686 length:777 start_codon:yes stop_codon:yes gene_type:complete
MSSRVETAVSFSLHEFSLHGGKTNTHCDGWGLANYRGKKAEVYREVEPAAFSKKMSFIQTHPYQTRCVISHIRRATVGDKALRNTQPFVRHINGRSHVFAHNGELAGIENKLMLNACVLEGETDSERAYCYLISAMQPLWDMGTPSLADRVSVVTNTFSELAVLGVANFLYSDGDYLFAFANKRKQKSGCVEPPGMYFLNRQCCCDRESLKYSGVEIFCEPQQLFLFASVPLTDEPWQPLPACQLLVVENGDLKAPNL